MKLKSYAYCFIFTVFSFFSLQVRAGNTIKSESSTGNLIVRTLLSSDKLSDLKNDLYTHLEKIEYLLDVYNRPLSDGDTITIYETKNSDGTYYPSYLKVDYLKDLNLKRELIGQVSSESNSKVLVVNYYQRNGEKVAKLWSSKTTPGSRDVLGLYDLELYPFKLPLNNSLLEEEVDNITAPYGERLNPFLNITEEFHYGTDFGMGVGTELKAPYNGNITIGYGRRSDSRADTVTGDLGYGKFAYIDSNFTYRTQASEGRRKKKVSVAFVLGHLSAFPTKLQQSLVEKKISSKNYTPEKYKEFFDWNMSMFSEKSEKKILEALRHFNIVDLVAGSLPIKQDDFIALSGETGRATGPHLHFEVIVNGSHVDPVTFYKNFGMKKGVDSNFLLPQILMVESLVNYNRFRTRNMF